MGETTAISWTDATFNPWIGCTKVSPGCTHCYAETQNKQYRWAPDGWGPGKPRRRTSAANWKKPVAWDKEARRTGIKKRVFCASLADVFDAEVPREWRIDFWKLISECDALEWLLLTKRPENIAKMMPPSWLKSPPDWIRIGVTAENQEMADKRIPELLKAWNGKNFISYEPALGPVDFVQALFGHPWKSNHPVPPRFSWLVGKGIGWVICGGESGAGCRPMDLAWARDVRDQCKQAGVPYFFKQAGGFPNKRDDPAEWPEDLRVQEFPQ